MNVINRLLGLFAITVASTAFSTAQNLYKKGDIVTDFELVDRATGKPTRLEDFKGSIVFLEWFAYWCPFCQAAAAEIGPGIVDHFAAAGGNINGIPVKHISLNLEPLSPNSTQMFIDFYKLGTVLNDFNRAVANRFQTGGQPIFAIINLVENSPSHQYLELLHTELGYGASSTPVQTFRGAINQVKAADAPPNPVPEPEPEPEPEPGNQATVAPAIVLQPVPQTVRSGQRAAFVAGVSGDGQLSYQWRRNGVILPTSASSVLRLNAVTAADAGDYTVTVTNALGSVTSAAVRLTLDPSADGRLVNLSSNAYSGVGADQLVPSFVAEGAMRLLVRAVGPTLQSFGVSGVLADPALEVRDGPSVLGSNGNWGDGSGQTVASTAATVGAFPLGAGSRDAALIYDYAGGPRSAPVTDVSGAGGTALVEVYEVPTAGREGRLVNLATRGVVQSGKSLVAGFVIGGSGARTVLIRGIGPALGGFGVPKVLVDPTLNLKAGSVSLVTNDDWGSDPFNQELVRSIGSKAGAFSLPDGSADAAVVITLSPGLYTVEIAGKDNAFGVVLAEIYDVTDI